MLKISPIKFNQTSFVKKALLAGAVVTTMLATGCKQKNTIKEDFVDFYVETKENKPLDFTSPNLPVFVDEKTIYKNQEGDVIVLDKRDDVMTSLYQAIEKHSTDKSPDIEEPEAFYVDVQKNILKGAPTFGILFTISKGIREMQSTLLFNKLYDMFTAQDSDKGKTISVKEYTMMMDAWSSTKPE